MRNLRTTHPRHCRPIHALAVALLLIVSHLSMNGEDVNTLYMSFLSTDGAERAATADAIYLEMYEAQFLDSLMHFNTNEKTDVSEAWLHYWMSEYYYDLEQFENALQAALRANDLSKSIKDPAFMSEVLGTLSNVHFRLGNYDEALKTVLEAYKIDKQQGNDELISSDLNTIAAIYLAVQQPEQGITFIEKAIDLERKLDRQDRLAIRLGMASELYLLNDDCQKAMSCIKEAHEIDKRDGREEKAAIRLSQMGAVLEKMGKLKEARTLVLSALQVLEKKQNTYSIATCHNQLGSLEFKLGNIQAANENYQKALDESISCGSPKVERTAERGLWETMRKDNPASAMLHLERYTVLTDSLYSKIVSTQIKVMDTTIENLEQTEQNNKNTLLRKWLFWGGIVLAILILLTAVGLYLLWRRSRSALQIQRQVKDLRSRFLNNITRELHTPLTVILNAGQHLRDGGRTSSEENRQIGEMIVNHGNNMLEMVNQLIDTEMVKDPNETPEWKQGDINMFTRLLVGNYTDEAHQQGVRLEFSSPEKSLIVDFVPDYLRKILQNLITNAFKFTPRSGSITVDLSPLDDNRVKLTVANTGKGIPTDELDRLFEPFTQGVNGEDAVGPGISLSLVNHLVKALKGDINVNSKIGEGTIFTVVLPFRTVRGQSVDNEKDITHFAESRILQTTTSSNKPMVFIVENNDDVAFFIANLLQDNYNLRFARDGKEAYQNIQDLVPDLIITNIVMPVMDGKELIRLVNGNAALKHIPVIAMTSITSEQERMSCMEVGADFVLVKPFNSSELKLVVHHLLSRLTAMRDSITRTNDQHINEPESKQLGKEENEFINKLINVIHAQMVKEDFDMEHIAAALSLSRKQLRTRVMEITGQTPVAFTLQVRLNHARRMITTEDIPLTTIARKCGFQTPSHFSKMFKQQFGISPQQYRKNFNDFNNPLIEHP